jgi:D-lactate dehydrogenase
VLRVGLFIPCYMDAEKPADAYLSANRTCEMGLLHATGRPYQSFVYLLEELSRP